MKVSEKNKKTLAKAFKRLLLFVLFVVASLSLLIHVFEDELKEKMLVQINQSSGLDIAFEDAQLTFWSTFPSFTLNTKELSIKPDSSAADSAVFSLESETTFFAISLPQLLRGNIKMSGIHVTNAQITLKQSRGTAPDKNMFPEVLHDLDLKEANFENVHIQYLNKVNDTALAILVDKLKVQGKKNDSSIRFQFRGEITPAGGGGVAGEILSGRELQLDLRVYTLFEPEEIVVESGHVWVHKNQLEVNGSVSQSEYFFRISGKGMNSENVKALIAEYYGLIKSGLDISGELDVIADFSGLNTDPNPSIKADFIVHNGRFVIAEEYPFESEKVSGSFTNNTSSDPADFNLKFSSDHFAGEELQFSGAAELSNLNAPTVIAKLDVRYFPQADDFIYEGLPYYLDQGEIRFQIDFKRKRQGWNSVEPQDLVFSQTRGTLIHADVPLYWRSSGRSLQLKAHTLTFNNDDIHFDSLQISTAENMLLLDGRIINVFSGTLMNDSGKKPGADLKLTAASLYPEELIRVFASSANENYEETQAYIVDLDFHIDSLKYKKLQAYKISGLSTITHNGLDIHELSLNMFDGFVSGNGHIHKAGSAWKSHLEADIKKADIHKLFLGFDDFGMEDFSHHNIYGNADAVIQFSSELDQDLNPIPASIDATADLTIHNGNLRNFRPIMESLTFLDEDLSDIHFNKLNNRIRIKNEKVHIPEMYIESDVLDFEAYGTHSFDHELDYHMRFLLSDLLSKKARHREEQASKFGEIEDDGLGRTSLYILMRGNVDKPEFAYDRKAVANKIKEDFQREKQNTIQAFQNEFSWMKRDSAEKAKARKKKKWIKKQEEGEFLFEWDDGRKEPN